MRIDRISLDRKYQPKTPVVACIGFFDGVHKGHQELIRKTVERAKELDCDTALITFEPDPWVTLRGVEESELEHLTTTKQKINLVVKYGIHNVYLLEFTKEMADLSPNDFVAQVLGQLNLKGLVCGYDFRFGARGEGDAAMLKEIAPCDVFVIEEIDHEGAKISSSRIVERVKEGDFYSAYLMLGHPFSMDGKIVAGSHQGTGLGFPTANVQYSPEYVIPKLGVYSAHVQIRGKTYGAMVNVGHNPTFNYSQDVSIEAHILNLKQDLYGEHISVIPEQYIRPEMQFKNRENLILQLESDYQKVRKLLRL
ncbi:MAG: bifunctional riboflavin kinase/FAD synthetase [Solobacterium sp.]|nr:bifunctional riboflavin kinase/FAD synthetase [Solobacterium sp.]